MILVVQPRLRLYEFNRFITQPYMRLRKKYQFMPSCPNFQGFIHPVELQPDKNAEKCHHNNLLSTADFSLDDQFEKFRMPYSSAKTRNFVLHLLLLRCWQPLWNTTLRITFLPRIVSNGIANENCSFPLSLTSVNALKCTFQVRFSIASLFFYALRSLVHTRV